MAEDTRQIEQTIRSERTELDRNLRELEMQAKELADWRTHYRRHAGATMAVAFGGGLLVGFMTAPRRGKTAPMIRERREPGPRGQRLGFLTALANNPRAKQQAGDAWNNIVETLVGLASAKAVEVIGRAIPGFRDEYQGRHATAPRERGEAWRRP